MARPKGSPNKRGLAALKRVFDAYPDYDPLQALAKIAHETDDVDIQVKCHKEIAQYVRPKLKAVDMHLSGKVGVGVKEVSDEQWAALAAVEHGAESEGT